MRNGSRLRPSPALVVATAAVVLSVSGAAVALPGKGQVKSNDIAKGAVKSKAIAKGAVGSKQIKGKSIKGNRIKDETIKSRQVAPNGLDTSNIADVKAVGPVTISATDGVDLATALAAAPETPVFEKGQISIVAKCARDTTADETTAALFVKTGANGAIFNGDSDSLQGGDAAADFLNTDTPEDDRELDDTNAGPGSDASYQEGEFAITAADGTELIGQTTIAAKNGELAGGNGVYGAGNVCRAGLQVTG